MRRPENLSTLLKRWQQAMKFLRMKTLTCVFNLISKKKKHQKNMNLAQQLRSEEGTGALIFSPTKIVRVKEIVAEEEKKTQKKKELKDRKVEIALGKQRKEFEREQKELNRKLFTVLKENDCLEKKLERNDTACNRPNAQRS
jgi:hypothetical protein